MFQLLILFLTAGFGVLWRYRPHIAWGVYAALLPTYLLRTTFGPLPTTLLELFTLVLVLCSAWQCRKRLRAELQTFFCKHYTLAIAISLFLLGATIGVFASTDLRAALGEWRAFYVEPVLIFFTLILGAKNIQIRNSIIAGLLTSAFASGLLTLIQKPTGWFVPYAFWENGESYRVTGWWGFPNGVGAFQAPLTLLWIYPLTKEWLGKRRSALLLFYTIGLLLSFSSLIFAKSTGGMIGVLAGIGTLLLCWERSRLPALILGMASVLIIIVMPSNPVKSELLAQDRSGQIRVQMWAETVELLKARPFFGAGMASYQDRIVPYHSQVNGENIEIFHHPHNTLLTMWVNTGIIGLFGFAWIVVWFLRVLTVRIWTHDMSSLCSAVLAAPLVATLVHGLVDSPYIKNDTSILFWLMLALFIRAKPVSRTRHYELIE